MPHLYDSGPILEAIKVTGATPAARSAVTYRVIELQAKTSASDKRIETRRRTRLHHGKVLDLRNRFLIDCQLYDRSRRGARLRLVADLKLPTRIRLFDDIARQVLDARIAWQRGQNIGVTFLPQAVRPCLTDAQITALRRKI